MKKQKPVKKLFIHNKSHFFTIPLNSVFSIYFLRSGKRFYFYLKGESIHSPDLYFSDALNQAINEYDDIHDNPEHFYTDKFMNLWTKAYLEFVENDEEIFNLNEFLQNIKFEDLKL